MNRKILRPSRKNNQEQRQTAHATIHISGYKKQFAIAVVVYLPGRRPRRDYFVTQEINERRAWVAGYNRAQRLAPPDTALFISERRRPDNG